MKSQRLKDVYFARSVDGRRPGLGRGLWELWKRVARRIADVQARGILSVVYFLVLAPFAVIVAHGRDPLALKPTSPHGWRPRPEAKVATLERARSQS